MSDGTCMTCRRFGAVSPREPDGMLTGLCYLVVWPVPHDHRCEHYRAGPGSDEERQALLARFRQWVLDGGQSRDGLVPPWAHHWRTTC